MFLAIRFLIALYAYIQYTYTNFSHRLLLINLRRASLPTGYSVQVHIISASCRLNLIGHETEQCVILAVLNVSSVHTARLKYTSTKILLVRSI